MAGGRVPGDRGAGVPTTGGRGAADRVGGWLRNGWRQLTSMRTALVLLFLLALAAIPGSLLPQRTVSVAEVNRYLQEHPRLAPVLERLGGFDVYASPWFSAIYLLLFASLVGCVVPRLRDHVRAMRRPPVPAPQRLSRLPQSAAGLAADGDPAAVGDAIDRHLRSRRWRSAVRRHDDGSVTVSAEKGYLKETGNLLMHAAMVAVLIGVALGASFGWHGNRLVVAGPEHRFCNTLGQFDEFGLGNRVDGSALPPFCFTLTDFSAEYTEDGQPTAFLARGEVTEDGGAPEPVEFTVNSPLRLDGAGVYLLGNGYAPVLRYTDRYGQSQTVAAPFRPIDAMGSAEGVATFPDVNVDPVGRRDRSLQVGFEGLYLPTAPERAPVLVGSIHPAERDPRLLLIPYRGDLGLDDGAAQSVWTLNRERLTQAGESQFLRPGETLTLDDGTTVEFLGTQRWITVSVRYNPGHPVLLAGTGLLLLGLVLSLYGHRRRIWFRIGPHGVPGRSEVAAGGLPRSDYPGFADEFAGLVAALPLATTAAGPQPVPAGRSS
jgi:cytochrome c biogenesis protein